MPYFPLFYSGEASGKYLGEIEEIYFQSPEQSIEKFLKGLRDIFEQMEVDYQAECEKSQQAQQEPKLFESEHSEEKGTAEKDGIKEQYTEKGLKKDFNSFKEAKIYFGMKAKGWKTLAEKLNEKNR